MKLTYRKANRYLRFGTGPKSQRILKQLDKFILPFLIAFAASISQARAQTQITQAAANEIWFDEIIGIENSGILNGPEYKMELMGASSNPFFISGEVKGMLRYNQEVFYAPLLYDIYKDEIIVKHIGASGRAWLIRLEKKLVQEFTVSGHLFRNFDRGFHEVIYEGNNFLVVSKRSKQPYIRNRVTDYVSIDKFFIVDAGRWTSLRNKQGFINMLTSKEDKKKVKLFLNQNKIKVHKFRAEDMVKAGTFINALRNKQK
jgi:hypothetical protein